MTIFKPTIRKKITSTLDAVVIEKDGTSSELIKALNALTARCFEKEVPLQETEERFNGSDVIQLLLQGREIVGYAFNDSFQLVGKDIKNKVETIREFINNHIALEIMEQVGDKIMARDFLNMNRGGSFFVSYENGNLY